MKRISSHSIIPSCCISQPCALCTAKDSTICVLRAETEASRAQTAALHTALKSAAEGHAHALADAAQARRDADELAARNRELELQIAALDSVLQELETLYSQVMLGNNSGMDWQGFDMFDHFRFFTALQGITVMKYCIAALIITSSFCRVKRIAIL